MYTTYTSTCIIMLDCIFVLDYYIVYGLKSCTVIMCFKSFRFFFLCSVRIHNKLVWNIASK